MVNELDAKGLIAVTFLILGLVYFFPAITSLDVCRVGSTYGSWENITETHFYNSSFPAIGRYYCEIEAEISVHDCLTLKEDGIYKNYDGCKWGAKTSKRNSKGLQTRLYVMIDPEITESITLSSLSSKELIDVGLDKTKGIKMDLITNSATYKCLSVEIEKDILEQDIGFILKNTNFDINNIKLGTLEKKSVESYQEEIYDNLCNPFQANDNGTEYTVQNCTKILKETRDLQRINWNKISIKTFEKNNIEKLDSFNILSNGTYRYCFDVPFIKNGDSWGSKGEVQVAVDSLLVTDRQGSSWWDLSWTRKKAIEVKSNNTFIDDPIVVNITGLSLATNNCSKELVIIDNSSNQVDRVILENSQQAVGDGSESCLIQFPMMKNADENQTYYVYYNNSGADEVANQKPMIWERNFDNMYENNYEAGVVYSLPQNKINFKNSGTGWNGNNFTNATASTATMEIKFKFNNGTTGGIAFGRANNLGMMCVNSTSIAGDAEGDIGCADDAGPSLNMSEYQTIRIFAKNNTASAAANGEDFDFWINPYSYRNPKSNGTDQGYHGTAGTASNRTSLRGWVGPINLDIDYIYVSNGWKRPPQMIYLGAEELSTTPPVISGLNCSNGTAWKSSFIYGEVIQECQVICTDVDLDSLYVNLTGFKGISTYDDGYDNSDSWFSLQNLTNTSGGMYTFTIPNGLQNESGTTNITAVCCDSSNTNQTNITWFIPWGTINISLITPAADISVQNGSSFPSQGQAICNENECGNVTVYSDPKSSNVVIVQNEKIVYESFSGDLVEKLEPKKEKKFYEKISELIERIIKWVKNGI